MVLKGLRSGNIAETCRRYGIAPNLYYRWKDEAQLVTMAAFGGKSTATVDIEKEQSIRQLERSYETLKARLNLLFCPSLESTRAAMVDLIDFCNYSRYHDGISNVTQADVDTGRWEEFLKLRQVRSQATPYLRSRYNLGQPRGEPGRELSLPG